METYKRDPKHPDAHPIFDGSENKRIVYDHSLLSEGQKFWEERRLWRKEQMKKRRLKREEEERKARKLQGIENEKEHLMYIDPYPGITPHDLDGPVDQCTECNASFWGTKYVYPLWQRSTQFNPVLVPPYCDGCYRLFEIEKITLKDKMRIIRWIVVGKYEEEFEDDEYHPEENINYKAIAGHMEKRANKMRGRLLYDHPSWDCLKSEEEINFEFRILNPTATEENIRQLTYRYIHETQGITVVTPKPISQIEIATPSDLKDLVVQREGLDAILGHRCSPKRSSELAITFDHIEPVSKVRYRPGSYSVANIQILSRCLNRVKGNYPNKELVRWLSQLLDTYDERYSE